MFSEEFAKMLKLIGREELKEPQRYTPSYYIYVLAKKLGTSVLEGVFASNRALFHLGVGKSVYCLKTAMKVYHEDWDEVQKHIVFMPQDFIKRFEEAIDKRKRIRLLIWDDAGFWVGRQRYQTKFVRAVREFLNVIRTHLVYLMVTAPRYGELARGIREQLTYVNFISFYNYVPNIMQRMSRAEIYHASDAEYVYARKHSKPSPLAVYIFKTYFPYYEEYRRIREKYVVIGKLKAEEAFKEIANEAVEEMNEVMKKVEPNVKLDDELDEEDEEEVIGEYESRL